MKYLVFLSCFALIACEHATQTTSGREYLSSVEQYKRNTAQNAMAADSDMSDLLKQVASVEPTLRFPARIGLARVDKGQLTNIPAAEIEAWMTSKENLGKEFGEFIPVSPLIAQMVTQSVNFYGGEKPYGNRDVISEIRLAAARQHLHAVLIYEVYSKSEESKNVLAVADWTIIGGYILPSRMEKADGYAKAMLIDVIQGYPYGTAEHIVTNKKSMSSSWGWGSEHRYDGSKLGDAVKTQAAVELTTEVEAMFKELKEKLDTQDMR